MFRSLTTRQLLFDILVSASCVLVRLALGVPDLAMAVVIVAMGAALGLRRANPQLALMVAWAGALLQVLTLQQPDVSNLAILPVLFATAAYGSRTVRWFGLGSAGAGALVIALYMFLQSGTLGGVCSVESTLGCLRNQIVDFTLVFGLIFVSSLVAFVLSWTLGLLGRTRRLSSESRAAQRQAELEQEEAERLAIVEQERNRIARDMHDVVAHSLAVVIAQADGARYVAKSDPGAVEEALAAISGTAREALGDVRILLGQLRHSQGVGPQPTLDDLDRLIEQMGASGLVIDSRELLRGEARDARTLPGQLGSGQQLAVFRIVQEALTNALRHGDTTQEVSLVLDWSANGLELLIDNAVAENTSELGTHGHGLAGMRERASLVGGSLVTGVQGERFVVTASIPFEPRSAELTGNEPRMAGAEVGEHE